jgi:hypothetical protein
MRNMFAFRIMIGIGVGSAMGVVFNNIPAGVSLGASFGLLANLFTWLEDRKSVV